jgi:hypothetical protein
MKSLSSGLVMMVFLAILQGCTTMADSIAAKGTGDSRVFDADVDSVWSAVLEVIDERDSLKLVSEDRTAGRILVQKGMSAMSYGENIAIFIEPAGSGDKTRVEVVSKRALSTTVFAKDWEKYIVEKLDEKLQ